MRQIEHLVVGGVGGRAGDVFDLNTGQVQARVPLGTAADLDRAVTAAQAAQPGWAAINPQRRARVMFGFKRRVEAEISRLPSCSRPNTAR